MFNVVEVGPTDKVEVNEDGRMNDNVDDDVLQAMLDLVNIALI